MKLWRLTPKNPDAPEWETLSESKGPAIIREKTEERARWLAHLSFWIAGERSGAPPVWLWEEFTRAEEFHNHQYSSEGPAAVLEPTGHDVARDQGYASEGAG